MGSYAYRIAGKDMEAAPLRAGLHLVATPVGNLKDITIRALETLSRADLILCEDTRVSRKLLERYSIKTPLLAYHEHNSQRLRPRILEKLEAGETIALISDAGTPLVSDPGYKLVRSACEKGIFVTALPGASASLLALTLSALPPDRFMFCGFLPSRQGARRVALEAVKTAPASLIFFESPKRLARSLTDMTEILGNRPAAIARELTKIHEELRRGDLAGLAAHYAASGPPKGEVVIVTGPPLLAPQLSLDEVLLEGLETLSLRDAAAEAARLCKVSKKEAYSRALELKEEKTGDRSE